MKLQRKLDNNAKYFSVEEKNSSNTFRITTILTEKVKPQILYQSLIKTLNEYPNYRVKFKTGFFWNYLEYNYKKPIINLKKDNLNKNINFKENNDYLFKVTYFNNKINIDIFHVLTDGKGAIIFLKEILYNYLNLKHKIKNKENKNEISNIDDLYLKYFNKKIKIKKQNKKVFLIKEKYNLYKNKTYHYILNLEKIKKISKKNNATITEFLTAIYIYAIYKTNYNKLCNKDIIVTIPINLRKYYNIESLTNFFTCMRIYANVINNKNITFNNLLKHIHNEFENKLTNKKINEYLARDVKLGTNIMIKLVPLFIKKTFMKYLGKLFNQTSTTTLSNVGFIEIEDKYKKYIDNIMISVKTNKIQKIACTVSSYNNKLTITFNSNLISDSLEKEFYSLLKKYIGNIKIYKSM